MKNYKQILEAINRGINLALDDFDDEELTPLKKSKQTLDKDYTKEYLDMMDQFVDLGLPSGNLWAKCNLGANTEFEDGNYYAWGEIEPKTDFTWLTYKYAKQDHCRLTKYCSDSRWGYFEYCDNRNKLLPEDDAATQTFKNSHVCIPSPTDFKELVDNCRFDYIEGSSDDVIDTKGKCGVLLTSTSNGNNIFFPFNGKYYGNSIEHYTKEYGFYWTSSLPHMGVSDAIDYCFTQEYIIPGKAGREMGKGIRPIFKK